MGVEDLGDLDGMLFVFPGDSRSGFWMKDTLIPLAIGFYDEFGTLVDAFVMEPCRSDPCPVHMPSGTYRYAVEVAADSIDLMEAGTLVVSG